MREKKKGCFVACDILTLHSQLRQSDKLSLVLILINFYLAWKEKKKTPQLLLGVFLFEIVLFILFKLPDSEVNDYTSNWYNNFKKTTENNDILLTVIRASRGWYIHHE